MRSGNLRQVATLQNPAATGDAYSTAQGYAATATGVRVGVNPLSGRELRAARQDGSVVDAEIVTWYRADITAASRLVVDGLTYQVVAVIDKGNRHREMRLQCKVVT